MSNQRFIQIASEAFVEGWFRKDNRRCPGKPGEFFNNLTEEDKESLRLVKSGEPNLRLDYLAQLLAEK